MRSTRLKKQAWLFLLCCSFIVGATVRAQTNVYARSFSQPKAAVEQALKDLQSSSGQKLPILDGFVGEVEKPLESYERGFYQFSVNLVPGDGGATVVTLRAKITAWYADRDVAKSGYQVLPSNGRLELDMLDRLEEKLTGRPVNSAANSRSGMDTPRPKLDLSGVPGMSGTTAKMHDSTPPTDEVAELRSQRVAREKRVQQLTTQLRNLQEIQKTQAHPRNLVAIQNSGTPIFAKNSASSRVLFQASQNDEFEFLDGDDDWIHVSISGDSRGYLQREAVVLSDFLSAKLQSPSTADPSEKFLAFRIEREEMSTFPGNWPGLRGKYVKIYTVLPVSTNPKDTTPSIRLNYALFLFQKSLKEAPSANPVPEGVVVIFDSADGGIAAATLAEIQRVASKAIARDAFWSENYLDPVEAFRPTAK
jgi:hypothetical protein